MSTASGPTVAGTAKEADKGCCDKFRESVDICRPAPYWEAKHEKRGRCLHGRCSGLLLYIKAILTLNGSVLFWYGGWNTVTGWGMTVEYCKPMCNMYIDERNDPRLAELADIRIDFAGIKNKTAGFKSKDCQMGWAKGSTYDGYGSLWAWDNKTEKWGQSPDAYNEEKVTYTWNMCPRHWYLLGFKNDMIMFTIGVLLSILSGTQLAQAGVTGTWIPDWAWKDLRIAIVLWIMSMSGQFLEWISIWNLLEQGFYTNNFCNAYDPDLNVAHANLVVQCTDQTNGNTDGGSMCGPGADFYDDGAFAYEYNFYPPGSYYYYYGSGLGSGSAVGGSGGSGSGSTSSYGSGSGVGSAPLGYYNIDPIYDYDWKYDYAKYLPDYEETYLPATGLTDDNTLTRIYYSYLNYYDMYDANDADYFAGTAYEDRDDEFEHRDLSKNGWKPQSCKFPINNYNYIGMPVLKENVLQDIIYIILGIGLTSLTTGLWSLGYIYPPWYTEAWSDVQKPNQTIFDHIWYSLLGVLSVVTQNLIWVSTYNMQLYYSNQKGDAQTTRDLGYVFGGMFLMWLCGSLVSAGWIEDEPDNAANRNLANDTIAIIRRIAGGPGKGKRPWESYQKEEGPSCGGMCACLEDEKHKCNRCSWYFRGLVATLGYFMHLNGFWNTLDHTFTVCTTQDSTASYCYSTFKGRNILFMLTGLFLLWWTRSIWWNMNIDPGRVFPETYATDTEDPQKKEKVVELH